MGKFEINETQGGNGETFRYKNNKGLYFVKRGDAERIDSITVQSDYLLLEVLNLLGIKTPTELLLAKSKDENADYILIKRAVADQENNKKIPKNKGENNVANLNTPIDIKWAVRNLAAKLLIFYADININQLHNTFPIVYNKKNGTKFQKFIHHDPLLNALNLDVQVENFFQLLKSDEDFSDYENIKSYFEDIEENTDKQVEIVGYLQKILYNIQENKEIISELINASVKHFCKQSQFTNNEKNDFQKEGQILLERINHTEKIITKLTEKFSENYTILPYHPRLAQKDSHIAHKVLPAFGVKDLE
jgi:hypothetical protein